MFIDNNTIITSYAVGSTLRLVSKKLIFLLLKKVELRCNMEKINLFVQPAYNYDTQQVEYLEILVRGYRGFDSVASILQFIKLHGIEEQFDIDILRETIRILNNFQTLNCPVGVNLCPKTATIEGVADKILDILKNENKSGTEIIIEINEETNFRDSTVKANVRKLRSNGVKIALDDFGVEGANLYTLLSCDIDIIKVDKAFIDNSHTEYEESQSKILKRLIQLCNDFNLKHIVEGIETNKQLNSIKKLGYSVVQGYLYEKPLPFMQYLDENIPRNLEEYKTWE